MLGRWLKLAFRDQHFRNPGLKNLSNNDLHEADDEDISCMKCKRNCIKGAEEFTLNKGGEIITVEKKKQQQRNR